MVVRAIRGHCNWTPSDGRGPMPTEERIVRYPGRRPNDERYIPMRIVPGRELVLMVVQAKVELRRQLLASNNLTESSAEHLVWRDDDVRFAGFSTVGFDFQLSADGAELILAVGMETRHGADGSQSET